MVQFSFEVDPQVPVVAGKKRRGRRDVRPVEDLPRVRYARRARQDLETEPASKIFLADAAIDDASQRGRPGVDTADIEEPGRVSSGIGSPVGVGSVFGVGTVIALEDWLSVAVDAAGANVASDSPPPPEHTTVSARSANRSGASDHQQNIGALSHQRPDCTIRRRRHPVVARGSC